MRSSPKIFLVAFFLIFSACGGGGGGSGSSTSEKSSEQIRFINVVKTESALDISLGEDVSVEELAYGESSGFIEVTEGKVQLRISSSERVVPILSAEQTISSASKQSFLLYDEKDAVALQAVDEMPKEPLVSPLPGESSVRLINMSEEKSSVDVYIVFPDDDLKEQTAAAKELAFKALSSYVSFKSGTYDIIYTDAGTSKIVRRARGIAFAPGKIYSHILLDQIGATTGQTSRLYEDPLF